MNTHKLPPLPHWCEPGSPFAEQMQAYALAAIQAQGVPYGWREFVAEVVASADGYERRTGQRVNAEWVERGRTLLASAPPAPQAGECAHEKAIEHRAYCKQCQQAKPQPLTDEQINQMWSDAHNDTSTMSLIHVLARAIESAACAERDARIAHLEATASANYKRGYDDAHSMLVERIAELERQLEEARNQMVAQKDQWLEWEAKRNALEKDAERWRTFLSTRPQSTHDVINQAIDDAAIRALKGAKD